MATGLIRLAARYPWPFLAMLLLATGLAVSRLDGLRVEISTTSMMERDTQAWRFYQAAAETFGADEVSIVYLSDPELFTADKLAAVRELVASLEALPFVAGTTSLFSVRNVRNEDGYISTRPYLEPVPDDAAAVEQIQADAIRNPLLLRNLISADGRSMGVNVLLKPGTGETDFDQQVTEGIGRVIAAHSGQFRELLHIGSAVIRDALSQRVLHDQQVLLPLSLGVLLVTLAVALRQWSGAVLPLLTAGLSVVWTLGLMAWLEIPVNIMTSIVPALIIVIGSTEDIHLLAEYATAVRTGAGRRRAIGQMADRMGLTVLLTFVTTYVGFLSITLTDIELVYQFGLTASMGLLFNFVITILLVPIVLRWFGETEVKRGMRRGGAGWFERAATAVLEFVDARKRSTLAVAALVAVVFLAGATQLRVNNNPMDFLEASSPIHDQAQRVHERLSGIHTFSVVVASGIENTFLNLKYLQALRDIQGKIEDMGAFDKSFSFADFVMLVNSVMADEGGALELPDANDIVREYMLFIQHRDVKDYVSADFSQARILVRHNIGASETLNDAIAELQAFIDENVDPALSVEITGSSILSNQAIDALASGQFLSLLLIGGAIFLIVSVLFINLQAGMVALLPNLLPVVVLFGVMGFTGIPLDAGTGMVAAIALGICVDDTMHVMARYHEQLRTSESEREALLRTMRAEAAPIFTTSIALAGGFGVLAASSFVPVATFGLLSAMVILLALIATFVITPVLLGQVRFVTVWEVLTYRMKNDALKRSPLFRGLNAWQIKKLLLSSEIREYRPDQLVFANGEAGSEMFIVLDGRVEARNTQPDGSVTILRHMGAGDLFGELAALSGGRRSADVVAVSQARALVLSWDRIDRLSRLYPIITFRLFRNLTGILGERLSSYDGRGETSRDDLTGIYSKSFFLEATERELRRSHRYDHPVSVIMVEIRAFRDAAPIKLSALGDRRLVAMVHRIRDQIRGSDLPARWDQNRFAVLLPLTETPEARRIAQRIESALLSVPLEPGDRLEIACRAVALSDDADVSRLADPADGPAA